jgi:hypothetical protein
MRVHAAICCTLVLFCQHSFSADIASSTAKVMLVAPLYITNNHFTSQLTLTNKGDHTTDALVTFDSLEGESFARTTLTVPARSSTTVDVSAPDMTMHRFAGLGSISVSGTAQTMEAITGYVAIASREAKEEFHVEEALQRSDGNLRPLQVGFVPAAFSVPLLAVHSLSDRPLPVSIACSDSKGGSYESQLSLPGRMTFLISACISTRTESRTYEQLLSGDTGPTRADSTIKIKLADAQAGAVSVWGFAVAKTADSTLQLVDIEFTEWDPVAEFLLD